jgi:hypothetical protein
MEKIRCSAYFGQEDIKNTFVSLLMSIFALIDHSDITVQIMINDDFEQRICFCRVFISNLYVTYDNNFSFCHYKLFVIEGHRECVI